MPKGTDSVPQHIDRTNLCGTAVYLLFEVGGGVWWWGGGWVVLNVSLLILVLHL